MDVHTKRVMTIPFFRVPSNTICDKDVFDVYNPSSWIQLRQVRMTDERLRNHQPLWFKIGINLGKDGHLAVQLLMNILFNEATTHLMVQTSPTRVTATTEIYTRSIVGSVRCV